MSALGIQEKDEDADISNKMSSASRPPRAGLKIWLFAFLLTAPMVYFFLSYYFNHPSALQPTGFIQYDNVSYVAYAKQYPEENWNSIFYTNPFNESRNHPKIYFQPHTYLFGILLAAGVKPGWVLIPFTLICALICFRLLIGIYDHLYPEGKYRSLSIWLFAWGGGLLSLAGIIYSLINGGSFTDRLFFFDPAGGWWGLNFGRSLFFSSEAYYHLLFLGVIYTILRKRWMAALFLSLLLSLSHPFTGIELLLIVMLWAICVRLFFKNAKIPVWFIIGILLITAFHLYYYLYWLNRFPEHRSVSQQYALNWRLRYFTIIPAYIIVAVLAIYRYLLTRTNNTIKPTTSTLLFLCWFAVAFTLANHELFIKPMQPLHFTRGYIWTALFLMGLPALHLLFKKLDSIRAGMVVLILFLILFFSDNMTWIYMQFRDQPAETSTGYISKEQRSIIDSIKSKLDRNDLIIGSTDDPIPYLSMTETNAYSWVTHPFTTPFFAEKKKAFDDFIESGLIDPSWKNRNLLFLFNKKDPKSLKRLSLFTENRTWSMETDSYYLIWVRY